MTAKGRSDRGWATCHGCGRRFAYRSRKARRDLPAPRTCGLARCFALVEWGDDDWEGRARMARARVDRLDDIDREALRRFPSLERGSPRSSPQP